MTESKPDIYKYWAQISPAYPSGKVMFFSKPVAIRLLCLTSCPSPCLEKLQFPTFADTMVLQTGKCPARAKVPLMWLQYKAETWKPGLSYRSRQSFPLTLRRREPALWKACPQGDGISRGHNLLWESVSDILQFWTLSCWIHHYLNLDSWLLSLQREQTWVPRIQFSRSDTGSYTITSGLSLSTYSSLMGNCSCELGPFISNCAFMYTGSQNSCVFSKAWA